MLVRILQCAQLGGAYQVFVCRNGEARRYSALLVYIFAFAGFHGYLLYEQAADVGHFYTICLGRQQVGFLLGNGFRYFDGAGVVGNDLAFYTVFQRCYNAAPVGIVFGVGSEDKEYIEGQAQLKATNLDIAFLQYIE